LPAYACSTATARVQNVQLAFTKSSAITEGLRDTVRKLKSC